MSNKNSHLNPKQFEGKSLKELQIMLKSSLEFADKFPQFQTGWHNEYIHELRKKIAEKIGKK